MVAERGRSGRRRAPHAAGVAALAVLLLGADGGSREPVLGGGSFNEPMALEVGAFRDTVGANESLFYVLDGPEVATFEVTGAVDQGPTAGGLALQAYDATRRPVAALARTIVGPGERAEVQLRVEPLDDGLVAPVTLVATRFSAPRDDGSAPDGTTLELDVQLGVDAPQAFEELDAAGPLGREPAPPSADGVTTSTVLLAPEPAVARVGLGVLLGVLVGALGWAGRRRLAEIAVWFDTRTTEDPTPGTT